LFGENNECKKIVYEVITQSMHASLAARDVEP